MDTAEDHTQDEAAVLAAEDERELLDIRAALEARAGHAEQALRSILAATPVSRPATVEECEFILATAKNALGPEAAAPGPDVPASEEAPVYAKAEMSGWTRWMITFNEGWRSGILCEAMYEADADFLLSVLGRTPRGQR